MELIESIMAMVALVILGSVINRYLVVVPVALIQAALGLIVALAFRIQLQVSTDWFMLLFMAPLLFNDGRHYPKRQLWYLRGPFWVTPSCWCWPQPWWVGTSCTG
ncbi:hypothetical protein [Lacticaseibacillus thailandensis]|uniref:hypothetical protein n=1 Tax=Lacticaseibacillus thailandensis TaxID=381741 RepID=UPI000B16823D|nr:hypothetical protein [Lacticaseibacillus thailandensis]